MRRASLLSGVAFRSALLFLTVFAVVLAVSGFAILKATQATMEQQIRSSITEDVELLHDANIAGGEAELINFVHDSLATRSDRQYAFGVFRIDGRWLAGNVEQLPHFRGWGFLDRVVGDPDPMRFMGFVETLDDNIVVVGRSTSFLMAISRTILMALIAGGIVIAGAALIIGIILSRGVSRKLDVMDETLAEVSRGNSGVRLPVGPSNDQIDHLSRQINTHLDRLSEFMGSMRNTIVAIAHDLKSPLNRAYIGLQEAAEETDQVRARSMLQNAIAEMEALRDVLDTVLRISRIENSDDSSKFGLFSAAELLRDLAQTFEPVIEGAGQTLSYGSIPATGAFIFGDRQMVQQMLVNLIENASRYAGNQASIVMGLREEAESVIVTISDTGPGIPRAQRGRVFAPFYRLNPERNPPGAGLGLPLVKAVATRHHANIELGDNEPGLKVTVRFPAPSASAPTAPAANLTSM